MIALFAAAGPDNADDVMQALMLRARRRQVRTAHGAGDLVL
jgi:hypothetical protein